MLTAISSGSGERKLKVEISNRKFENRYEIKNFLGINIKVMVEADMFAHKVCALLDRNALTNRDIFDSWFFMQKQTPINTELVEARMSMPYADYIQRCIDKLESMSDRGLLRTETISLFRFYKDFPLTE